VVTASGWSITPRKKLSPCDWIPATPTPPNANSSTSASELGSVVAPLAVGNAAAAANASARIARIPRIIESMTPSLYTSLTRVLVKDRQSGKRRTSMNRKKLFARVNLRGRCRIAASLAIAAVSGSAFAENDGASLDDTAKLLAGLPVTGPLAAFTQDQ